MIFQTEKFPIQRCSYSSHISFLRKCLQLQVKPKFIKFRFYSDCEFTTKKLEKSITDKWIRTELRRWYGRLNVATRLNLMVHSRLSALLPPGEFDLFMLSVNHDCRIFEANLRDKKSRKITSLVNLKASDSKKGCIDPTVSQQFQPRVINFSRVQFNREETCLLEKGLKFSLPPPSTIVRRWRMWSRTWL